MKSLHPDFKAPEERVLPTLNQDGSRRWLRPKLSKGRFLLYRRIVAYVLMAFFILAPYVKIGGKPSILLNLPDREFTFFGMTFLATDTIYLFLFLLAVFLSVFWFTALLGRVWCGWGCPQTVYLEFVFRPLERLIEGSISNQKKIDKAGFHWRRLLKWVVFFFVSTFLAHIFISYFVSIDALVGWFSESPFKHPAPFLTMVVVTFLILFNFSYFREQTCTVACPYGRFQSVLLDKDSLIVAYDIERGEPRGKRRKGENNEDKGDCIDCTACVLTCPTGIDIREGLQMECINCTQCIDACDAIMEKVNKPTGLIRYSSEHGIEGKKTKFLRMRTTIYPVLLLLVLSLFFYQVFTRKVAKLRILRLGSAPYKKLQDGRISNQLSIVIYNQSGKKKKYFLSVRAPASFQVILPSKQAVIEQNKIASVPLVLITRKASLKQSKRMFSVVLSDKSGNKITKKVRFLAP